MSVTNTKCKQATNDERKTNQKSVMKMFHPRNSTNLSLLSLFL